METLVEYAHQNFYNDHMMGMPILGSIYNIRNISRDMIVNYHNDNYVGKNFIIVAGGEIEHATLEKYTQKYFGNCATNSPANIASQIE
jgi:predicted Zn-dependent peptidase